MKIFKVISGILASVAIAFSVPQYASAEYITAVKDIHYEKYVVDTSRIFYPDANNHKNQFNVLVYYYHDIKNQDKSESYVFKYKFDEKDMKWYIHADGNWNVVEQNSVSSDVLRVCIPFLK